MGYSQLFSRSLQAGLPLKYWNFYSPQNITNNTKIDWISNRNDLEGYDGGSLYIDKAKYDNIREEILNSGYVSLKQYKQLILLEATKHLPTKQARRMIYRLTDWNGIIELRNIHYGLKYGDTMSIEHLISIICYTDFDELQRKWSSTFGATYPGESIIFIKRKNQCFYYLSKLLMEAVQCFGNQCMTLSQQNSVTTFCEEFGPFYCGMSSPMPLPSMNIRLNAPTSTSIHEEIAMKFANEDGIIIQFNNNGININERVGFLDVSWISTFKEESER